MKQLKTPLRYPGGKSRAVPKLFQHLPDLYNYREFREPFVGGASMALAVTKQYPDISIWVNDLYEPLVNFWKILQTEGEKFTEELLKLKQSYNSPDKARLLFAESKECLAHSKSKSFDRGVSFYILNKCSFSGLTESSSFSAQASENNFSVRGIEKLPEYSKLIEKWNITNYSYNHLLDGDGTVFVYLDPPYDIKDNLYGNRGSMHKGFDHDKFAADCDNYPGMDMMVSYNSSQLVRDRFKTWKAFEFSHTYTMRSVGEYMSEQHQRKELVLINYEV